MNRPRTSITKTLLLLLVGALLAAATLRAAEPHAIVSRGFQAEQVYDFNGIDNVNLFNGNLVVTIPIGQRFPLGGGFDYGFTLVYNSHIWDYVKDCPGNGKDEYGEGQQVVLTDPGATDEGCVRGIPNPSSNAGTSWRISLGDLYDIDSPVQVGHQWVFVSSDGADHKFFPPEGGNATDSPQYTRDGSHLRLRATDFHTPACAGISGLCMAVDRPDGVTLGFEPAAGPAGWRLHRIEDPFGNSVSVTYQANTWTIEDSAGRIHTIHFDAAGVVSSVELAAFAGQTAQYDLVTQTTDPILPACPHDFQAEAASEGEALTQLTSLTLPGGAGQYSFSYVDDDGFNGGICSHYRGSLEKITLPTGGDITYGYGGYQFPVSRCEEPPIRSGNHDRVFAEQFGITSRTTHGLHGEADSERHYVSGGIGASPTRQVNLAQQVCILPRTTYTDVYEKADQGRYRLTRNFFSIASNDGLISEPQEQYEHTRYGLPIDHLKKDKRNGQRFRSTMVFDCPSYPAPTDGYPEWSSDDLYLEIPTSCYDTDPKTAGAQRFVLPNDVHGLRDIYLEYDHGQVNYCDGNPSTNPSCDTSHWREKSNITYFYDTPANYRVETTRSDFDGYGHYRETVTRSNSFASVDHTTFVDYQPSITPTTWLLGLFDEMTVTEPGGTSAETYSFDATTGFLDQKTTLRADGTMTADFTPDDAGNVQTETYSGGDSGQFSSYSVRNEFSYGTLSKSEYQENNATLLRTVDADIDQNTGLPSASRDTSGLETHYTFDLLGRLTGIAQVGLLAESPTTYQYQEANVFPSQPANSTPAKVTITRGDTTSAITFDGLGRVTIEKTSLPGPPADRMNRKYTSYTPMGQVKRASTLHESSPEATIHNTETDYDIFGRPTLVTHPDDGLATTGRSRAAYFYEGIFKTIRILHDVDTSQGAKELRSRLYYDDQGRLVMVEELDEPDPNASSLRMRTRYSYDEGGRLVRVNQTDTGTGQAQIRTFDYDEAGLLAKECHPELAGRCIEYGRFDARGNPTQRRYDLADGEPFELDYTYDGAERLTQVRSASDQRLLKEYFYNDLYGTSYTVADGNGKLYQSKRHNDLDGLDVVATVTNQYGGIGGRLSRRLVTTGGDGDVPRMRFITGFSYDSLGDLEDITYPGCADDACGASPPNRAIRNSYTRGLLTGIGTSADPSQYASISYHPNMTVAEILHGNGVYDALAEDPAGLPRPAGVEVRTDVTPDTGTLWSADYSYDGTGNLATRTSLEKTNTGAVLYDQTDQFGYDNVFNRLVSATVHYPSGASYGTETRNFSYDRFGNLTGITGSNPRTLATDPATNRLRNPFTYDPAGNLTSQPQWDATGNPKSTTDWYYTYDPFNKMTRARNAAGSVERQYLYTADGERLATVSPGRELWTLRGPDNQVLRDIEHLSTGWRWVEDYVYRGSGLLASISNTGNPATAERHYHLDHLGSPRLVTGSLKQVVARHVFAPYGEELTAANQDELRLKFTGHERDDLDPDGAEGDLDYMHARYCSSQLGRFLSVDPKERYKPTRLPQRWNRLAYAAGSPLKYLDPNGEDLKLLYNFDESGLSLRQQHRIVQSVRRIYRRAGVNSVQSYFAGGSTKPTASKPTDRVVKVNITSEPHYATRTPDPRFQSDGSRSGNTAKVSTARGSDLTEQGLENFVANTVAHESGHTLFDEESKYLMDAAAGGGEKGTVMEAGVQPDVSAIELREFSEEDAAYLRELLNDPEKE